MRYLTKEWFLSCQAWPISQDVQKKLDDTMRAFRASQLRGSPGGRPGDGGHA